jgi:zinc protease
MKTGIFKTVMVGLLMFFAVTTMAQQAPPVPIDPKVRYGKLENGLTYYIRANKLPKERAEFYMHKM